MVKEQKAEMDYMFRLYKKGALNPTAGETTMGRLKMLEEKAQSGAPLSAEEIAEIKRLSEIFNKAEGGRVGYKFGKSVFKGIGELFNPNKKMFRSRDDVPTSTFSEMKGPITLADMQRVPPSQLRKIMRTQELGLYDETPEILAAGNLLERFTKVVGGKRVIDYERAEAILGTKLRGDETLDELFEIEFRTRPKAAEGGLAKILEV